MTKFFLKHGADLQQGTQPLKRKSLGGSTPLHLALRGRHNALARVLVAAGAFVDEVDGRLWSPLMICVDTGNREMVEYFLDECGADVNMRERRAVTITSHTRTQPGGART